MDGEVSRGGCTRTAPMAEEALYLENIGTSLLVSERQMGGLHKLMIEAVRSPTSTLVRRGSLSARSQLC